MSHESFHSENLEVVRKILFSNYYPQDLIEKHIKIRIQQIKSRKSRHVDTDTQSQILDKNNTCSSIFWSNVKNNSIYVEKNFKSIQFLEYRLRWKDL